MATYLVTRKSDDTLHKIEVDLRRELAVHDARISVVETKVAMYHPSTK